MRFAAAEETNRLRDTSSGGTTGLSIGHVETTAVNQNEVKPSLFQTAKTTAINPETGQQCIVRLAMDTMSSRSYIRDPVARKLGLSDQKSDKLFVSVFGTNKSMEIPTSRVKFEVVLRDGKRKLIEANTTKVICHAGAVFNNWTEDEARALSYFSDSLADDPHDENGTIDILVGANLVWEFIEGAKFPTTAPGIFLIPSKLGLMLGGESQAESNENDPAMLCITESTCRLPSRIGMVVSCQSKVPHSGDVEKFADLENVEITDDLPCAFMKKQHLFDGQLFYRGRRNEHHSEDPKTYLEDSSHSSDVCSEQDFQTDSSLRRTAQGYSDIDEQQQRLSTQPAGLPTMDVICSLRLTHAWSNSQFLKSQRYSNDVNTANTLVTKERTHLDGRWKSSVLNRMGPVIGYFAATRDLTNAGEMLASVWKHSDKRRCHWSCHDHVSSTALALICNLDAPRGHRMSTVNTKLLHTSEGPGRLPSSLDTVRIPAPACSLQFIASSIFHVSYQVQGPCSQNQSQVPFSRMKAQVPCSRISNKSAAASVDALERRLDAPISPTTADATPWSSIAQLFISTKNHAAASTIHLLLSKTAIT
jgi:hypothetical protein